MANVTCKCGCNIPVPAGHPVFWAEFKGIQHSSDEATFPSLRLYNVFGDHPVAELRSTVTIETLVDNNILVPDQTPEEVDRQYREIKMACKVAA